MDKKVRILLWGDSNAVGSVDTKVNYEDGFIADTLRSSTYDYIVDKFALGGKKWTDFAGRHLQFARRPLIEAADAKADWGVIILGTNDISAQEEASAGSRAVQATLEKMKARLVSDEASHILVVAPFNFEPTKAKKAEALQTAIRKTVDSFGATWIDPAWQRADCQNRMGKIDRKHFTVEAAGRLARFIHARIRAVTHPPSSADSSAATSSTAMPESLASAPLLKRARR